MYPRWRGAPWRNQGGEPSYSPTSKRLSRLKTAYSARNWSPTSLEEQFVYPLVQERRKIAHPLLTKGFLPAANAAVIMQSMQLSSCSQSQIIPIYVNQQINCRLVWVGLWLASFPGPKRRRRKGLVSAIRACANRTIDTLPYACDARIDTKRNSVRRFMVAKYGMQETHSIVLIQRPIWSYKQTVRASVESADEKKRLPTGKTIARGNLGFHQCASVCSFC